MAVSGASPRPAEESVPGCLPPRPAPPDDRCHDDGCQDDGCRGDGCRGDAGQGGGCEPCVPAVGSEVETSRTLAQALAAQTEPIVALTWLLRVCRQQHAALSARMTDPDGQRQYAAATQRLSSAMPAAGAAGTLDARVRHVLAGLLSDLGPRLRPVAALAAARLLDERYAHTFGRFFHNRSPYSPSVGDPLPLDSPDLPQILAMPATSPPWRLANRLDETRHVRLAGGWANDFEVIFDYSASQALSGVIHRDTMLATCHPNRALSEFSWPSDGDGRTFPVTPRDGDRQRARLQELISRARAEGATVIVLPELCLTEAMAHELRTWVDDPAGPRLLVAGSFHHGAAGGRARNTAIAWVRGRSEPLECEKHSPADTPVLEGIRPAGRPQLRVFVTDDGWHLLIAICRDLLNPHAVHAMGEAGVNLALVPAMSESLVPFGGPTAQLVGMTQALVVVANGPAEWASTDPDATGPRRPARALFGHPGYGQQTRFVHTPDGDPGVSLLTVGSGQLRWLSDAPVKDTAPIRPRPPAGRDVPSTHTPDADPGRARGCAAPQWLTDLAGGAPRRVRSPREGRRTGAAAGAPGQPRRWRDAAVLVLLSGDPHDPLLLLTQRADDLAHYPGLQVFPGGSAEAADRGPVSTALREAAEETGLRPESVEILGSLPRFALPDGFIVTPVLGWAHRPDFSGAVNLAEVVAVQEVRLRDVHLLLTRANEPPDQRGGPAASPGPMTAMVLRILHDGYLSSRGGSAAGGAGSQSGRVVEGEPAGEVGLDAQVLLER